MSVWWSDLFGKESTCFYLYFESIMSWLILQNDRQSLSLGNACSVLCKIGHGKSNYCCEVWRDKPQNKIMAIDAWLPCVFLFQIGWIAGGWEAYSCNYRHYVSQCPVSNLDWLPNFPHLPSKSPWSWVGIEPWSSVYQSKSMTTIPWRLCLLCWWIMVATLACTGLVTEQL